MFKLAIIGRPNVGKSTLFNRLVGKKMAIVDDQPGVTRDRKLAPASIGPMDFIAIDTAGLEQKAETGTLESKMMQQTQAAIEEADILLMVVDGREGITPTDEHFARLVRKADKPLLLAVNKCEGKAAEGSLNDAFRLGLGEAIGISAEHGEGMADLYDALQEMVEKYGLDTSEEDISGDMLHIAIAGRPNVGKSTFFNKILGEERSIANEFAGTTRDAVYVDFGYVDKRIRLVDTAGLRKRTKRTGGAVEEKSVADSYRAIRYANVVVLMVDGLDPMNKIDLQLASHIIEEGRGMVIAVNKWDAVKNKNETKENLATILEYSLAQGRGIPVIYLSALEGSNVHRVMKEAFTILERWNMRISTGRLNRWLMDAQERHNTPLVKGRRIRLRYATQVKARPPTIALFSSSPISELPESYLRYLMHSFREHFDMAGVPVRMLIRKGKNPFEGKKK